MPVVCISRSQASSAPEEAGVDSVVYNPIDVDSWPVGYIKDDYLLFVARVGDARVDLLFERVGHKQDSVALTDVAVDGNLDVVLEIPRAPAHDASVAPPP
jgi:hypothetical protein